MTLTVLILVAIRFRAYIQKGFQFWNSLRNKPENKATEAEDSEKPEKPTKKKQAKKSPNWFPWLIGAFVVCAIILGAGVGAFLIWKFNLLSSLPDFSNWSLSRFVGAPLGLGLKVLTSILGVVVLILALYFIKKPLLVGSLVILLILVGSGGYYGYNVFMQKVGETYANHHNNEHVNVPKEFEPYATYRIHLFLQQGDTGKIEHTVRVEHTNPLLLTTPKKYLVLEGNMSEDGGYTGTWSDKKTGASGNWSVGQFHNNKWSGSMNSAQGNSWASMEIKRK